VKRCAPGHGSNLSQLGVTEKAPPPLLRSRLDLVIRVHPYIFGEIAEAVPRVPTTSRQRYFYRMPFHALDFALKRSIALRSLLQTGLKPK
jgi:hypothetical protein